MGTKVPEIQMERHERGSPLIRWLLFLPLFLIAADFDCVVVGTSPFSLFEALYQSHLGKRVLILEENARCGGAWKGIDICGLRNVDLGCHQIGKDLSLKEFIEEYAGCQIVSMENPEAEYDPAKSVNGWYFAHGCAELIEHLLELIRSTNILLWTETKLESALIDPETKVASLTTPKGVITADKMILTPMSALSFSPHSNQNYAKSKHYHLYLLVQDATPYRFTYRQGLGGKSSRLMNLTPFVDLAGTGRQLIVVQTPNENGLEDELSHLELIKKENLLDPGAYILQSDRYIYESGSLNQSQIPFKDVVQILQTGHFNNLNQHIAKWKTVLKPYREAIGK